MSTMTEPTTRPLAPLPVAPYESRPTGDGEHSVYGWCQPWCQVVERYPQHGGASLEEHGDDLPWCEHQIYSTPVRMTDGTDTAVGVALAAPYLHGVYRLEDVQDSNDPFVRLTVHDWADDPADRLEAHISPSTARSMAAALLRAADALERFERPVEDRRRPLNT